MAMKYFSAQAFKEEWLEWNSTCERLPRSLRNLLGRAEELSVHDDREDFLLDQEGTLTVSWSEGDFSFEVHVKHVLNVDDDSAVTLKIVYKSEGDSRISLNKILTFSDLEIFLDQLDHQKFQDLLN